MPVQVINCPRCQSTLQKKIVHEKAQRIEIDECNDCGGMWFDANELPQLDHIIEPVLWEQRSLPSEEDQLVAMNCPSCEQNRRMEKHEHPRDAQVIIDVCIHCRGIWLDGGELRAIQQQSLFSLLFGI